MAEETFKVNTEENTEDKSVKVEQDFDTPEEDGVVLDTWDCREWKAQSYYAYNLYQGCK